MDYLAAFDISASGMAVERTRLDVVAMNLANVHTTRGPGGGAYVPLQVISGTKMPQSFAAYLASADGAAIGGTEVVDVRPRDVSPRMVYQPTHPDADARGFVAFPNVNPMSEMVTMIETLRAYEANVQAMNASKTMAQKALEIGSNR